MVGDGAIEKVPKRFWGKRFVPVHPRWIAVKPLIFLGVCRTLVCVVHARLPGPGIMSGAVW